MHDGADRRARRCRSLGAGIALHTPAGERVGRLTSGGYSVAFGRSIGMGYVAPERAVEGTKLKVKMLGSLCDAIVTCDSPYDPGNAAIRKDV